MRWGALVSVMVALHAGACRRQAADSETPFPSALARRAEENRDTVRIEVGTEGRSLVFSAPQSGGTTSDVSRLEQCIGDTDRTVLDVEPTSDPATAR